MCSLQVNVDIQEAWAELTYFCVTVPPSNCNQIYCETVYILGPMCRPNHLLDGGFRVVYTMYTVVSLNKAWGEWCLLRPY